MAFWAVRLTWAEARVGVSQNGWCSDPKAKRRSQRARAQRVLQVSPRSSSSSPELGGEPCKCFRQWGRGGEQDHAGESADRA